MTESALVENIPDAPEPQSNSISIIRYFLRRQGYDVVGNENGQFRCSKILKYDKYAICDIILIAVGETIQGVDELIARLDLEYQHFHRAILAGSHIKEALNIRRLPFIRLQKTYSCNTYEYQGAPVAFRITPLILIGEENIWEHRMGKWARIDLLSMDSSSLQFFMQQHEEELRTRSIHNLNFNKFFHWKIANYSLNYGHYPLILLWLVKLITAILQVPFALDFGGMISITALIYGGIIIGNVIMYHIFRRCQLKELRWSNGSEIHCVEVPYDQSIMEPQSSIIQEEITSDLIVSSSPSISPLVGHTSNSTELEIQRAIVFLLKLKDIKIIIAHTRDLLVRTLNWLSEQNGYTTSQTNLIILLKQVKDDARLSNKIMEIKLWVRKLLTNTPFTSDEVVAIKKFCLLLLNDLHLLPNELSSVIQQTAQQRSHTQELMSNPPEDEVIITNSNQKLDNHHNNSSKVTEIQSAVVELPNSTPSTPNLNVESIPQSLHPDLPSIQAHLLEKMWDGDPNGIKCTMLLDGGISEHLENLDQFNECVKNLDVRKNYIDQRFLKNQRISEKFANISLPAVLIKCGVHEEVIPFHESGDEVRLHRIIESILHPPTQIKLRDKDNNNTVLKEPIVADKGPNQNLVQIEEKYRETEQSLISAENESKQEEIEKIKHLSKFFSKGSIMIDGSNIAYLLKDHNYAKAAKLECIFSVIELLISMGFPRDLIVVYFDANIRHKFEEQADIDLYAHLIETQPDKFREVQAGTIADNILMNAGKQMIKYIIITNDKLRNQKSEFRQHRVSVTLAIGERNFPCLSTVTAEELIDVFYGRQLIPQDE